MAVDETTLKQGGITMSNLSEYAENIYKARDWIVEKVGGPADLDLVEVLASAMTDDEIDGMTVDEVKELVLTIARQRDERES
jgi:hypothetical protein